jgi:hypothetical protein
MNTPEPILLRSARWLAFASAVGILLGIAISQIFLALAFAALLASGEKLRLPRIWLPLALFMAGTLISLAFSGEPAAGLPQVRKFYVYLELLVIFSLLRNLRMVRWLFLTWAGIASIAAIRGGVQFAGKVNEAHRLGLNFYEYYVGQRITGFTSHWNTYSAEEMFALIMLGAFLLFAVDIKRLWVWLASAGLISLAILLGETRGIWIAMAVAARYLMWAGPGGDRPGVSWLARGNERPLHLHLQAEGRRFQPVPRRHLANGPRNDQAASTARRRP